MNYQEDRCRGFFLAGQLSEILNCYLLDEPGNFVDTTFENDFYEKLRELNKRMAILMVSHDVGTISSHIKSFACVNRRLHYHPSHEITNEDLAGIWMSDSAYYSW